MQIEDLKRWHWVAIALVIGALMGMMWNMTSPDEKGDGRGTSAFEFVGNIARQKTSNGYTWIRQTVVYPPEEHADPVTEKTVKTNYVICSMLTALPNGKYKYEVKHFSADIPFKVGNIQPKSETYSIRDYLAETKAAFPELVDYKYAWWAAPKAQYMLWMTGAVLLIGGVWPSLVNLMIGAGMGRPKSEKKDEYDLSRFGNSLKPTKKVEAAKPTISAADSQRLQDLQEQLAQNVSGMELTAGEVGSTAGPASSAQVVKPLTGSGEPLKPVVSNQPEEPREYTGEFYPVVKTGHNPAENAQKH
jgi:hypothetical protein